jgi:hypothetical protein
MIDERIDLNRKRHRVARADVVASVVRGWIKSKTLWGGGLGGIRVYIPSIPEGPSPDGPGMCECLIASSGPSGDGPSGMMIRLA